MANRRYSPASAATTIAAGWPVQAVIPPPAPRQTTNRATPTLLICNCIGSFLMASSPVFLSIVLTIIQLLQQVLDGEAGGARAGNEFAHQLIQLPLALHVVAPHLLVAHKCARPLLCLEHAADFQFAIGPHHRVGVNRQ